MTPVDFTRLPKPVLPNHPADMAKSREWAGRFLSDPTVFPISFELNDRAVHGIPEEWHPGRHSRRIDANIMATAFEGHDAATGLKIRIECTEYQDYPVVEWVAWLTNNGHEATPVISDILAMDGTFVGSSPVLHHCNGDFNAKEGYTYQDSPLRPGETMRFVPDGGRPCDSAYPYHRLVFEDSGISMAIGWPGQWSAGFEGLEEGVHVKAGQETTNLRLMPGESIRTPHMTVMSWSGDPSRAVNLWRRWYVAHILPRPNGQPLKPLLACCGTDEGQEFTAATEENQIRYMEKAKRHGIPFDVWWIDAGWYPCYDENHERQWKITGSWEPDPERFPNGLKPVSDCAARNGADLLLWFEPERVHPLSRLYQEHPEWVLLSEHADGSGLLNLADPACRRWLTDHVCRMIRENRIKIYRQDFNIEPLAYWRDNDTEDRQGITENLYVQGYLRFWDDLLARNPGLWIDACAGGGRRNDLETMRRSVPLHYVDYGYQNDPPVKVAYHHTLYQWIPYFKECTLAGDIDRGRFDERVDNYSYHCAMAPMLMPTLDVRRDDYDYAAAGKMIDIWRRASELILYGDYYPHTPFHRSDEEWDVLQFDCPEKGCGLIQGIRFPSSPEETITIHPRAIDQDAIYRFEDSETGETRELQGAELINTGFTFALPQRSGAIWFYQKQTGRAPHA